MNERGHYGRDDENKKGWGSVAVVIGIAAAIYASAPGTRHFYRYGALPELHGRRRA